MTSGKIKDSRRFTPSQDLSLEGWEELIQAKGEKRERDPIRRRGGVAGLYTHKQEGEKKIYDGQESGTESKDKEKKKEKSVKDRVGNQKRSLTRNRRRA